MILNDTHTFEEQRLEVDIEYHLREYDDYLLGRRKSFSSALMSQDQGPRLCGELLKVIFERYMHWTPFQVRDTLDQRYIDALRIKPLINRIPCPLEIDRKREFYYVAWYLYKETINVQPGELIIKLYKDVLDGKLAKYPKNYFDGNKGYTRARILLLTMIREFLPKFENIEAVYAYFASDKGRQCINAYKLSVPLRELYGSPLAYLHDALSDDQKDWDLYDKYSPLVEASDDDTHINFSDYTTPASAKHVGNAEEDEPDPSESANVTKSASVLDDGDMSDCFEDMVVPSPQDMPPADIMPQVMVEV